MEERVDTKIDGDAISDGYFIWDLKDTDYEYMSPRFWTTLGYNPDDMPHTPSSWQALIHPDDSERATKAFFDHVKGEAPYHLLVRYKHAEGHWVWVICRGQATYDEDGTPDRMLGAHTDVTDLVERHFPIDPEGAAAASKNVLDSMQRILGILEMAK